jgi:hypothetical protein
MKRFPAGPDLSPSIKSLPGWSARAHAYWHLQRQVRQMRWPGAAGIGLAVFSAMIYIAWLQPARDRLNDLRSQVNSNQARIGKPASLDGGEESYDKLARFHRFFPSTNDVQDLLKKVFAAAEQQKLVLDQAEYRIAGNDTDRLIHYQITLPVRATYPQVMQFLNTVLREIPALAVESIQFERPLVGDNSIDAKIRFALFLEQK